MCSIFDKRDEFDFTAVDFYELSWNILSTCLRILSLKAAQLRTDNQRFSPRKQTMHRVRLWVDIQSLRQSSTKVIHLSCSMVLSHN